MKRVELACHTGYSRMKGIGLGRDWVQFALKNDIETLVITDRGNVDAYVDIQQEIDQRVEDIKLIMGADLFVIDDRDCNWIVNSGRVSVLIRNETGRKNLYKILSEGRIRSKDDEICYEYNGAYTEGEPVIPLSLLLNNREGLLIGSGTENSILLTSILIEEGDHSTSGLGENRFDRNIYNFFDYIEIPAFDILDSSESLIELADGYGIPAVAVSAPYYTDHTEEDAYHVLLGHPYMGDRPYLYTDDLLEQFDYLGKEKAYELVVRNSNKIASMCDAVSSIPYAKTCMYIDDQDEKLKEICYKALPEKYPEISDEIKDRLEWELEAIRFTMSAFMFLQIKTVIDELGLKPYEFNSRGSVGASMVAYLCGITEVDPIRANLSPYLFYGFKGNREPDIDLNFSLRIQPKVQDAYEKAPGVGTVLKAGSSVTISDRYAEELIDEYSEGWDKYYWDSRRICIREILNKCVSKRQLHPGGILVFPQGMDVNDICPVTTVKCGEKYIPANGFYYHDIDHLVYKFDALAHDTPEILKRLADLTGTDPSVISLDDQEVMGLFKCNDDKLPGCAGIPEFCSEFAINVLQECKPQDFDDLVSIASLIHGTGTWIGNAEVLLEEGQTDIKHVLASRNDIYDSLIAYGIDEETAYLITEAVRKGKVYSRKTARWQEGKETMTEHGVPDWFIWSCEKIKYMFPRAHSYSYMIASWRIAWYKLHYPLEFYFVMLSVSHGSGFDAEYMAHGKERLNDFEVYLRSDYAAQTPFTKDALRTIMLVSDYYDKGFEFKTVEDGFSDGEKFRIADDHTIEVSIEKSRRNPEDYADEEDYLYC